MRDINARSGATGSYQTNRIGIKWSVHMAVKIQFLHRMQPMIVDDVVIIMTGHENHQATVNPTHGAMSPVNRIYDNVPDDG